MAKFVGRTDSGAWSWHFVMKMTEINSASSPQDSTIKLEWLMQRGSERIEHFPNLLLGNQVTYEDVACTKL